MDKAGLLARLAAIGTSVAARGSALAVLALGSVGVELDRIDAYSDLDLFVIVKDGYQQEYIGDLSWLSALCPIAYCFKNTAEGYKLLFEDGIYVEFAVFSLAELAQLPFPEARIVWKAPGVDDAIRLSQQPLPPRTTRPPAELIGEVLTNLYVGLGRYHRGERLSAARFIQGYPIDRLVELAPYLTAAHPTHTDAFTLERRFEQRFPALAAELPRFMQGYDRSPESAAAILDFLERHWPVDPAMIRVIRALLPAYLLPPDASPPA